MAFIAAVLPRGAVFTAGAVGIPWAGTQAMGLAF